MIRNSERNFKEKSVFSGKIFNFEKKIYINLN